MQISFEVCYRWQQVTAWAHIRLRARFRPVSPTSPAEKQIVEMETNCRNGNKRPLLTLDYQNYTPLFSQCDLQMTKILVSKMMESMYE